MSHKGKIFYKRHLHQGNKFKNDKFNKMFESYIITEDKMIEINDNSPI